MNFAHLLKAFDAAVAIREVAKRFKSSSPPPAAAEDPTSIVTTPQAGGGLTGHLEARLTNVVVAALKEAFDRDHARLELERAQIEERRRLDEDQRRRAEEALRLEIRRQAADRELGRLRLLAGTALVAWIASLALLAFRAADAGLAEKIALGSGWLLLIGSLATAFSAQAAVNAHAADPGRPIETPGTLPLWLLVGGLASTALSLLM